MRHYETLGSILCVSGSLPMLGELQVPRVGRMKAEQGAVSKDAQAHHQFRIVLPCGLLSPPLQQDQNRMTVKSHPATHSRMVLESCILFQDLLHVTIDNALLHELCRMRPYDRRPTCSSCEINCMTELLVRDPPLQPRKGQIDDFHSPIICS